jgi:hypothetical protein
MHSPDERPSGRSSGNGCNPAAGIFLVFPLLPDPLLGFFLVRAHLSLRLSVSRLCARPARPSRACGTGRLHQALHWMGKKAARSSLRRRREENLRAMRSPASLLLAGASLAAVLVATVFYDRPITDNPVLISYLRDIAAGVQ